MSEIKLQKALLMAGWATLIGYIISAFANNMLQIERAKNAGIEDEFVSYAYIFGSLIESPLHVTTGLLCLFAALFLKRKPKSISETFE